MTWASLPMASGAPRRTKKCHCSLPASVPLFPVTGAFAIANVNSCLDRQLRQRDRHTNYKLALIIIDSIRIAICQTIDKQRKGRGAEASATQPPADDNQNVMATINLGKHSHCYWNCFSNSMAMPPRLIHLKMYSFGPHRSLTGRSHCLRPSHFFAFSVTGRSLILSSSRMRPSLYPAIGQ